MKLLSLMAVPIEQPMIPLTLQKRPRSYFFDRVTRFSHYEFSDQNENFDILKDDLNQWYFIDKMPCINLTQLKSFRQVHNKSTELYKRLPIIELLERFNLELAMHDFDKAFAHALCIVDNIDQVPLHTQQHIANFTDETDQVIINEMHYLQTIEDGLRTRYITGTETRSFATITENKAFAENEWQKGIGINYLKLFLYYKQYNKIPSNQMMAKLLCNLWASSEALNTTANPALYSKLQI